MPSPERSGVVEIGGKQYLLAIESGEAAYRSGARILESVPSDRFFAEWTDWSSGIGEAVYSATGVTPYTHHPGIILPHGPAVGVGFSDATGVGLLRCPMKSWLMEQSADGSWYILAIGDSAIVRLRADGSLCQFYKIGTQAFFDAHDHLGIPVKIRRSGTNYLYIPCNNGNRILRLTLPLSNETTSAYSPTATLASDIGSGDNSFTYTSTGDPIQAGDVVKIDDEFIWVGSVNTGTNTCSSLIRGINSSQLAEHSAGAAISRLAPDTFTAVTSITTGAAHFATLSDSRVVRAARSFSAGVFQGEAKISLLPADLDPESFANWGEELQVGETDDWIVDLLPYGDYIVVGKQRGWYIARENADGTLRWERIVEPNLAETRTVGDEAFSRGTVWHGQALLPMRDLYRFDFYSARPIGPASRIAPWHVTGATATWRLATVRAVVPAGRWAYIAASGGWSLGGYIAMIREPEREGEPYPVIHPVFGNVRAYSLFVQQNGASRPRLWWSHRVGESPATYIFQWLDLDEALEPHLSDTTFGSGTIRLRPPASGGEVLYRQVRLHMIRPHPNVSWGVLAYMDNNPSPVDLGTLTDNGAVFFPANASRARDLVLSLTCNGSASLPPGLVAVKLDGYYLPEVGETIEIVVDVERTAMEWADDPRAVASALRSLRYSRQSWTSPHDVTGEVFIADVAEGPPPARALPHAASRYVTVRAELIRYT